METKVYPARISLILENVYSGWKAVFERFLTEEERVLSRLLVEAPSFLVIDGEESFLFVEIKQTTEWYVVRTGRAKIFVDLCEEDLKKLQGLLPGVKVMRGRDVTYFNSCFWEKIKEKINSLVGQD